MNKTKGCLIANFATVPQKAASSLTLQQCPKSLAKQLAPKGIRVNAVAPGPYWTVLQCCGGQPQEKIEKFGANAPLGRPGQPVEIAPLYVTLAAEENSYTSGQVWCSDGGTGTL
ncbi:SDR family oxidoreductase [Klebsiella pneumoniae]